MNSHKQYKAVFLDWDDTIGDFYRAEQLSLREIYAKYDINKFYASFADFYNTYHPYNIHLWELYGRDEISKEELAFERFYHPVRNVENGAELANKMKDDFLMFTTENFSVLPDAVDMVKYLAEKYPLTIVSNGFIEVQYEKIRRSGLAEYFSNVVLSEEVGAQKPNPKIFYYALQKNNLTADEVIMLGDGYSSDIQGAINAGIDQIWYQREELMKEELRQMPATYKIKSLMQVKDIL